MRTLDIEFEGQQHPQPPLNNGFRPHGGYRGTNRYPLSQYTFNKSSDDRKKLRDDLDRLFGSDSLESLHSPGYAIEASRESNHSGESPLFEHRLLAPSRLEQKLSTEEYVKEYLPSRKKTSRPSSGVQYYRPESPHQYMSATSRNQKHAGVKYGRPTRTTLLRARNRCNSAAVNIYKMRKEVQKQYEQKLENRRPQTASVTVKDLLNSSVSNGETIHGFLIGARYNRAHCLDSKSVADHGVYMPRGNPLGCFITRDKLREEDESMPATPPDSLMSNSDDEEEPPSPKHKQAWTAGQTERRKITKHDITLMQHYVNTDDGLNIKGTGVDDSSSKQTTKKPVTRPNSSRINYNRSARAQSARLPGQSSTGGPKPFVRIEGKSLPHGTKSLEQTVRKPHTSREPSNSSLSSFNNRVKSGKTRNSAEMQGHNWEQENGVAFPVSSVHFHHKSSRGAKQGQPDSVLSVPLVDQTPIRNEIESVFDLKLDGSEADRISTSVENGAPSEVKEDIVTETPEGETEQQKDKVNADEETSCAARVQIVSDIVEEVKQETGSENQLETKRTSKVRFADEVEEIEAGTRAAAAGGVEDLGLGNKALTQVGQGDNAVFFITEEREESTMSESKSSGQSKEVNVTDVDVVDETPGKSSRQSKGVNITDVDVRDETPGRSSGQSKGGNVTDVDVVDETLGKEQEVSEKEECGKEYDNTEGIILEEHEQSFESGRRENNIVQKDLSPLSVGDTVENIPEILEGDPQDRGVVQEDLEMMAKHQGGSGGLVIDQQSSEKALDTEPRTDTFIELG